MRQKFALWIVGLVMLVNLLISPVAYALPFDQLSIPGLSKVTLSEQQRALFDHLETQVIPQIEQILGPTQSEQFRTAIAEGTSFRKAFKAITLSPEQKRNWQACLNRCPKGYVSLTHSRAEKEFFLKKKEMFMPTAEEIGDRISAGLRAAGEGESVPDVEAITERIKMGLERKASFAPSVEEIVEKIKQSVPILQE